MSHEEQNMKVLLYRLKGVFLYYKMLQVFFYITLTILMGIRTNKKTNKQSKSLSRWIGHLVKLFSNGSLEV